MKTDAVANAIRASLDRMADVTPGNQVSPALADKFSSLMQNAPMKAPERVQDGNASMVSQLIDSQDAELQHTINDMTQITQELPKMSMNEMAGAMGHVMLEAAGTTVDLSLKTSVVSSSKGALETLMKNQ